MERRAAFGLADMADRWRYSASAATEIFASPDGRWAVVSTSVTALIAGSVAWLAAGIMPNGHGYTVAHDRALMPYQLFLKLAGHNAGKISYASLTPSGGATDTGSSSASADSLDYALADERSGKSDNSSTDTRTITLDRGDTLVGALTDAGVSQADANAVILALARVYDPKAVRAGEGFDISFTTVPDQPVAQIIYTPPREAANESLDAEDDAGSGAIESVPSAPVGKLLSLSYSPTVEHEITIARGADGTFNAQDVHKTLQARYHRAGATIDSSLYLAAMQAGIPADVVVKLIHMFSYEVDFQRDLKPGNSFEVLYNYYYAPNGQPAKEGDIQYAALNLNGRSLALYRYQPKGEPADYFDARGQSARSMLMKTPVDGARITSGFGMRFHPILGYSRMHKGVDFGVPIGTPVMAAGSGVVQQEGRLGGYGNFMSVNHQNGYSTAYGHLSRFAPGIHVGSRVRQGQVIAYSGNTGMSTGPHLHYEIRVHDMQVNPASVKIATGQRLFSRDLRDYLVQRLHVDTELASMPLESKVAEGGGELRAMRD